MSDPKTVPARALVDIPECKAKAGEFCEVPAEAAKALQKDGKIDLQPGAVDFARKHHMPAKDDADQPLDV